MIVLIHTKKVILIAATTKMTFYSEYRYPVYFNIILALFGKGNPLFMRNSFSTVGKWEIPLIKKEELSSPFINLIACSDTRPNDNEHNRNKGVHFFVDDYRFEDIYYYPERSLKRYSQYAFLLTPDFSLYADMPLWKQMENIAKNRWIGAYWQFKGLKVIPSVSVNAI